MNNVPEGVSKTLAALKKKNSSRLSIKCINNRYYVYSETSEYSKELKRSRILSHYIGRISDGGLFISKKPGRNSTGKLEEEVERLGGKIIWGDKKTMDKRKGGGHIVLSDTDKKIVTCLAMNARMSFAYMSRLVGLPPQTCYARVKGLERRFGIKYITGVDTIKIGYLPFMLFIKFGGTRPSVETLTQIFGGEPRIIFAGLMEGKYDLVALMLVENSSEANIIISMLRADTILRDYDMSWSVTPYIYYYGIVPHSEYFYDKVLSKITWKRAKRGKTRNNSQLLYRQLAVLKELEMDGRVALTEIDRKHSLPKGTARYTYEDLVQRGILSSSSIHVSGLNVKYIAVLILEYTKIADLDKSKHKLLEDIIEQKGLIDKYALIGELGSPNGLILFMPVTDDNDFDMEVDFIRKNINGVRVISCIITKLLTGYVGYRRYDFNYLWRSDRGAYLIRGTKGPTNISNYGRLAPKQINEVVF